MLLSGLGGNPGTAMPAEAGPTGRIARPPDVEESMTSIESSLDRLAGVAGRLNTETDALNLVIEAVERRLDSMNLGISYWDDALLEPEEDAGTGGDLRITRGWVLGYHKVGDEWRVAVKGVRVEEGYFENDLNCPYRNISTDKDPVPLLRASRSIRVQAAGRVQAVLDGLAERGRAYVATIGNAKKLVSE